MEANSELDLIFRYREILLHCTPIRPGYAPFRDGFVTRLHWTNTILIQFFPDFNLFLRYNDRYTYRLLSFSYEK